MNSRSNTNQVSPEEQQYKSESNIQGNQIAPEGTLNNISPAELENLEKIVGNEGENKKGTASNLIRTENEIDLMKRSVKDDEDIEANKFDEETNNLIDAFISSQEQNIQNELKSIKKNIVEQNIHEQKKIIFLFAVLKADKEISNLFFKLFKPKLLDVSTGPSFQFTNQSREEIRNNQEILNLVLKAAVSCNYENLAKEILKNSYYYKCDDELIKLCIDNDNFLLLKDLLKKTKQYLQDQTKKNYSAHSRFSQMQSYKTQFLQSLSMTIQNVLERNAIFWQEHDRANDNIQKCLLRKEEKIARKLLVYYFIKFSRNFIKYTVLDFAISNECYGFIKKYFDIYPKTRYRIKDFNAINKIVEILDDEECFLHGIFLLSKVNARTLSEVHVRLIIDKYWLFLKDKLMLITYTLNPILVCVQIIENLKVLSLFFSNVRIKLKSISEEFLKLASLISDQFSDEIMFRTILLKVFYPSQVPLLKILYSDKKFYSSILKSELISNIVSKIWFCEYNWTFNFLNSSSAFKNLTTHFGNEGDFVNPQAWRFKVSKMVSDKKSQEKKPKRSSLIERDEEKVDYSMKPIGLMVYNKTSQGGYVGVADYEIDFKQPFEFYKKTRFSKDVRMTNHILSYFYFEKSPCYKVVLEFLVYMIFFAFIVYNMFELFGLRRYFENSPIELLTLADGLLDLQKNGNNAKGTTLFYQIMTNYTLNQNYTGLPETFYSFKGLDATTIGLKVLPWYKDIIPEYFEKTDKVWNVATTFWALNLYFYAVFLQNIFEMIFFYLKTKKVPITGKFLIDTVLFSLNIYFFDYYFGEIDHSRLVIQNNLIEKFTHLEKVMTFFIFIMWFKFIIYLKLTKRFGIVVKVIENMSMKLGIFMVVLCIVILAFASVCFYLFDQYNPEQFGTFWITLRTLIQYLFGNVVLDNFHENRLTAGIVLNIYSFLLFVLLLNLIIAILSSDFFEVSERGNLENANTLYFNYQLRKPDKHYSLLSSIVPPLNVLVLFFAPFLIRKRNSKLNSIGCMAFYIIYSFAFIPLYIITNLALAIPLCYIRLFFTLIINIIIKRKFYLKGSLLWLLWVFASPFYMIGIFFFHDIPLFLKSMYYPCTIKDRLDEITMEEIMLIDTQCRIIASQGKDFITHVDLTELIKDDLVNINKKFRRNSLLQQRNKAWNILQSLTGKSAQSIGIADNVGNNSNSNSPTLKKQMTLGQRVENEINVFVEIDKMEVFSFLRQFNGINGMIDVKRLRFLISQIRLCKRFNLMAINKTKQNKLINVIQVVDMFPVEKSVINIMAEQVRDSKIFENVLKKFIC